MKITESYLRKIIRGAINEMIGGADGTLSFHDSPPPQEEPTGSPSDIVDQILSAYQKGDQVDGNLLSKLQQLQSQLENAPRPESEFNMTGLGESRKRK